MKYENADQAYELAKEIQQLKKQLDIWEKGKSFVEKEERNEHRFILETGVNNRVWVRSDLLPNSVFSVVKILFVEEFKKQIAEKVKQLEKL